MKLDRRARYTRSALKTSLIELMKHSPVQKITVTRLCQQADIHRATFYAHYENIEGLLQEIEDDFYESIKAVFDRKSIQYDVYSILINALNGIVAQRDLCRVLVSPYGNKAVLERLLAMVHDRAIDELAERFPHTPRATLARTYGFFSNGSVNVVVSWILAGMKESPEEIAAFILGLMEYGLRSLRMPMITNDALRRRQP